MILRWTLYVVAAIAGVAALVMVIGFLLPQNHRASRTTIVDATPAAVWATLLDVARYAEWRPDVSRIEMLGDAPRRWREHAGGDTIAFEATKVRAPELLVVRIVDPDLPFGGTWTYELRPEGNGTRTLLTITEDGEVYNPIFRFVSRFVFGHTATIDRFIDALHRRHS